MHRTLSYLIQLQPKLGLVSRVTLVRRHSVSVEECISLRKNGLDIDFELERIVDEEGNQIQATSHYGARPFNKEEQQKIWRVNACLSCHSYESADKEAWDKVAKNIGKAPNDKLHNIAIETIMNKAGFNAKDKPMMKDMMVK